MQPKPSVALTSLSLFDWRTPSVRAMGLQQSGGRDRAGRPKISLSLSLPSSESEEKEKSSVAGALTLSEHLEEE